MSSPVGTCDLLTIPLSPESSDNSMLSYESSDIGDGIIDVAWTTEDSYTDEELQAIIARTESQLTDPYLKIRNRIVEQISPYKLLRIIVNLIWIVEGMTMYITQSQKVDIIVNILRSMPELNDHQVIFWSLTEDMYKTIHNRKLDHIRRRYYTQKSVCCCGF